jgi:putative chitinase
MLTVRQLVEIMPRCPADKLDSYARALSGAMAEGNINTVTRAAVFLAHLSWESNQLQAWEENLDYTAEGIVGTWSKRFPSIDAARNYEHNPAKLANCVYASRYGNQDEASGDGWTYRGRGPIQLTFRNNYKAAGAALNLDLEDVPDKALLPAVGFRVAAWYFTSRGVNLLSDARNFEGTTRAINGAATLGPPSYHAKRLDLIHVNLAILGTTANL